MKSWTLKPLKYAAVGRISLRSHLAYVYDFLIRSVFLIIVMYIFMQLWQTTYLGEGKDSIAGYSYRQLIWYILLAEALTMAFPSLSTRIEEEVKSGDVGYKLTRPLSYIGYHYMAYLSEVYVRLGVNLTVGFLLGWLALGYAPSGWGWVGFLLLSFGSVTVNFLLNMGLALCAFWVEETRGLEFVYHKLLFTIGGMLMPLELFPEWLARLCRWLPFQAVLYFPSKAGVRWDDVHILQMAGVQLIWGAVLTLAVGLIYRLGVKKLHLNGG